MKKAIMALLEICNTTETKLDILTSIQMECNEELFQICEAIRHQLSYQESETEKVQLASEWDSVQEKEEVGDYDYSGSLFV